MIPVRIMNVKARAPGGVFEGAGRPRQPAQVVGVQREGRLRPLAGEAGQRDAARQRYVAVQVPVSSYITAFQFSNSRV